MIVNYNRNHSFIVLATVITIINYDIKTFILQATDVLKGPGFEPPPGPKKTFIVLDPGKDGECLRWTLVP
jgi:hypothetical protein